MLGFRRKSIVVASPVDGAIISISKLSDPVFREDVLGRGIAVLPNSGYVRAPAKGVISLMFETGHAVNLLTDSGIELLIHVGIDTVKLKGRHYTIRKNINDNVDPGDILMEFDADAIRAEGYDTVTPVVVCNPYAFSDIIFAPEGEVKAGEPLITLKV